MATLAQLANNHVKSKKLIKDIYADGFIDGYSEGVLEGKTEELIKITAIGILLVALGTYNVGKLWNRQKNKK